MEDKVDFIVSVDFLIPAKDGLEAAQLVAALIKESGISNVSINRVAKSWR